MEVLSILQRILKTNALRLLALSFRHVSGKGQDLQLCISENNIPALGGVRQLLFLYGPAT